MKALLRRVFLENVGLKLVALVLAVVLFLYLQGQRRRDLVTSGALVKLTLVAPPGKVLTITPVEKLTVTLRGPRPAIQRLSAEGVRPLTIDLRGWSQGPLRFTSAMLDVPRGLSVESIQPPQIDLVWEDLVTKKVAVLPRVTGQPADGYRLTRVQVDPPEVQVAGARGSIEPMTSVELRQLQVEGYDKSVALTLPVQITRKHVEARPAFVRIRVTIEPQIATRRFVQVPASVVNPPSAVDVVVRPERLDEVVVEGPAPTLARFGVASLRVVVDLEGLGIQPQPGRYRRAYRIEGLPPQVRLVSSRPTRISVIVRRKPKETPKEQEAP